MAEFTILLIFLYINQQDAQIFVDRLYFSLDALHVSNYISPSSGATSYDLYIAFGICRYMPDVWHEYELSGNYLSGL